MGDYEQARRIEAAQELAHVAGLLEQAIRLGLPEHADALRARALEALSNAA